MKPSIFGKIQNTSEPVNVKQNKEAEEKFEF